MTLLLPILAFLFGSLVVTAVTYAVITRSTGLNARLRDVVGTPLPTDASADIQADQVAAFLKRIGKRLPQSPAELGKLQLRLVQAGYRGGEALPIFLGIRVGFGLLLFAICMTPIIGRPNLFIALGAMGFGYLLPPMVLARRA